jgi:hypothetical protein
MGNVLPEELPWVLRAMQGRISDIHSVGKSFEATPISASYDKIIIRTTSSVFDPVWEFSGMLSIFRSPVPRNYVGLCKRLKNMECELEWRGIIRRRPFFKSLSGLVGLKNHIPSISPDNGLAEILNSTPRVVKLIERIGPDTVLILFSAMPVFDFNVPQDVILKLMVESYENPQNFVAMIKLTKLLTQGLGGPSTVLNILDVIDEISHAVRRLYENEAPS